ncbi:hypothetical protein AM493_08290 [Flavobacterium akiainvivens]|uniref:Right handed beta helix domain-containing protein n=1 Tax=Flavobacterium akiainvivens TaxID=1202724 RepID=A0A0M8MHR9_9FLAO|nr:hypothetical protein [Flavobacterium akiainvivens]KOS06037.1 hypothetical protein AM493_08290 [Flavobacterium akiainvivens]SFQ54425.1 hypothetical protein SAMN05444144_107140 [Flavobacterium akiainvivens]
MRHYLLLLLSVLAITFTSCRDDFEFEPSTGGLEFSRDTVYLDTVFTNIGSSTYTLKVYNRSDKDITIPTIKLAQGEASKYRLMVDGDGYGQGGTPGKIFNNVELLAKDSLFIFIETTIDYSEYANNTTTFLYTDKIEFDSGANYQDVDLVTLVQDAIFIKPNRELPSNIKETLTISGINDSIIGHELTTPDELHWTNDKPYVVYGYAFVPNGRTLTIDAGARVHFHAESGLIVDDTGTLLINGSPSTDPDILENEVIFEGDRLEPQFAGITGQWFGVWLPSGSQNVLNNLTIKNAVYGLWLQRTQGNVNTTPRAELKNCQIYNCSNYGLRAVTANINGSNVVINNAGEAAASLVLGGTYNFKHCTFTNYSNNYQQVPVMLTNFVESVDSSNPNQGIILASHLNARFDNCILYGSGNIALSQGRNAAQDYNVTFNHSLIKLVDYSNILDNNELYPYAATQIVNYNSCVLAETTTQNRPEFENPQQNKLRLFKPTGTSTGPENAADNTIAQQVGPDLANNLRPLAPDTTADIGAYESIEAPE